MGTLIENGIGNNASHVAHSSVAGKSMNIGHNISNVAPNSITHGRDTVSKRRMLDGWYNTLFGVDDDSVKEDPSNATSEDGFGSPSESLLGGIKNISEEGLANGNWPKVPSASSAVFPSHSFNSTTQIINDTLPEQIDVLGPEYHTQLRQGILAVMFVVALFGNCIVMWKLKQKWSKRGRMTIMSFNLTLADLLVVLITILGQLMWEVVDRQWYLSNGACKVFKVATTFAITSSNYMLVAIAIDRHEAVVRPLNPFISAKNLALAAWAVSLLPSLPNFFIFFTHEIPDKGTFCISKFYTKDLDNNFRKVYLMMVLVLVFISTQVLVLFFYLRIYFTIWRKSSYFKRGQSESRRTNSLLPKAKTKTLNMTITIVAFFFITNTPYVITELQMAFGDMNNINPNILALFGIISASNSCFNPFIYLFFSPKTENRSPESYRVTFSRRWNTYTNGIKNGSPSTRASLTSSHSQKATR